MLQVIKAPNPRLRIKTKPVKKITPALVSIIKQMIKLAKTFKDPEGVGLASTQIGLDGRFFVAKDDQVFKAFINPQIIWMSKRAKKYFEGCLSIPNYFGESTRSSIIKVSYQDLAGKKINKTLKGVVAWIFQHEMDHLNGVLFSDRVLQQAGKFYKYTGKDKTGQDCFEEVTI